MEKISNIGEGIPNNITSYVETGRSDMLEKLQGQTSPVDLFKKVPGIGNKLSQQIVNKLGLSTLEETEQPAYGSRLFEIDGFGEKIVKIIKVNLAGMLSTSA